MSKAGRPSFDPKKARGAAGAFLFDSIDNDDTKVASKQTVESESKKAEAKAAWGRDKADANHVLTVTEITDRISAVLVDHLPRKVRVVGEISNLSKRGHWYFSLKDEKAVIGCVAWASKAKSFRFEASNGMEVVATGTIQFYSPQGRCQLYVDRLEPVGAGALELQFKALCEELRKAGYFDAARKKVVPTFPRGVAVITSEKGAALQDVLDTLRRRCPAIDVYLVDVRVQGAEAAGEVAKVLRYVGRNHERYGIDAVIITRGGGSMEDLWAFNERVVADALLDFPIPTIAAIGHETDSTIAEFVADVRCATPTQAAMVVSPDRAELGVQLDSSMRRMSARLEHMFRLYEERLRGVQASLGQPDVWIRSARERLESRCAGLRFAMERTIQSKRRRLDSVSTALERNRPHRITSRRERALTLLRYRMNHAVGEVMAHDRSVVAQHWEAWQHRFSVYRSEKRNEASRLGDLLQSIDPKRVLKRGYSITRRGSDGQVVRSIEEIEAGALLQSVVADGMIESEVKSKEEGAEAEGEM